MPFEIETQKQDQWCWAAVSVSIEKYFEGERALSQCEMAHRVLGVDCCASAISCNKAAHLQKALSEIHKLRDDALPGSLSFTETKQEIENGMPIGVRIGWFGGGGHFVVIRGYRESGGEELVSIADPWFVDSIQYFDVFSSNYLDLGKWTDTFRIKNV
jgi:hypothetical protein